MYDGKKKWPKPKPTLGPKPKSPGTPYVEDWEEAVSAPPPLSPWKKAQKLYEAKMLAAKMSHLPESLEEDAVSTPPKKESVETWSQVMAAKQQKAAQEDKDFWDYLEKPKVSAKDSLPEKLKLLAAKLKAELKADKIKEKAKAASQYADPEYASLAEYEEYDDEDIAGPKPKPQSSSPKFPIFGQVYLGSQEVQEAHWLAATTLEIVEALRYQQAQSMFKGTKFQFIEVGKHVRHILEHSVVHGLVTQYQYDLLVGWYKSARGWHPFYQPSSLMPGSLQQKLGLVLQKPSETAELPLPEPVVRPKLLDQLCQRHKRKINRGEVK